MSLSTAASVGRTGIEWRVEIADTRRDRMRGLRGRTELPTNTALLIPRARSVHTFGMRFPIKVALLDAEMCVLSVRRMTPGRLILPRRGVRHVLECAEGGNIRPGDRVNLAGS